LKKTLKTIKIIMDICKNCQYFVETPFVTGVCMIDFSNKMPKDKCSNFIQKTENRDEDKNEYNE